MLASAIYNTLFEETNSLTNDVHYLCISNWKTWIDDDQLTTAVVVVFGRIIFSSRRAAVVG
jgi:hypothetical protein